MLSVVIRLFCFVLCGVCSSLFAVCCWLLAFGVAVDVGCCLLCVVRIACCAYLVYELVVCCVFFVDVCRALGAVVECACMFGVCWCLLAVLLASCG